MKSTSAAPNGIVRELLTEDNYEKWRVVMQKYLQGQGLWEIVEYQEEDAEVQTAKKHVFQVSRGREIVETIKNSWNHLSPPNETADQSNMTPDIEQGICGVIQSSEVETNASRNMKDAKALHIIQLSCGQQIFDEISHFETARSAWHYLREQYGCEFRARQDIEEEIAAILDDVAILDVDRLDSKHKRLFRIVERGFYIGNVIMDQGIDILTTSDSGSTLLHVAVIAGNEENVEKLVKRGGERLLNMQDEHGYTALALAACYTGNVNVAKCMLESNDDKSLLTVHNEIKEVEIPVLLSAAKGHKEMTTYLYNQTPHQVFDSRNQVLLLLLCITAEIFDVALKLLKRYPLLPKESLLLSRHLSIPESFRNSLSLPTSKLFNSGPFEKSKLDKFSVLEALAKMPSAYPSGCRLSRREQFIYDVTSVDKEIRKNYGIPNIPYFILTTTCVAIVDTRQKTSSAPRSGFGRDILNFLLLIMLLGLFCGKQVLKFLFLPIKFSGRILYGIAYLIAYLFVQICNYLNISGVKKIYDRKYTHYEVLGILYYFSKSIAEFNNRELKKASAYDAMLYAAQNGTVEFINAMKEANPDLLSAVDSCNRGIISYAILNRKQNVFQLIRFCDLYGRKDMVSYRIDKYGNNLLHLAAYLGPSSYLDGRSGAVLQMQREIQWFKAVEKLVLPMHKEAKNNDGKKPYELFTETHNEKIKAGEKWAKETATSFTLVGALITTIMFAAAFTVPGGNNQETGLPIFLNDKAFTTFLIADIVSLFTSITSVLIFIGILTSRYAEMDFLKSFPLKLLFGLLFLFLSVCSMIVAFCASIHMILKGYRTYNWFLVGPALALGSIPIIVLLVLLASQLHLMHEIMYSTNPVNPIGGISRG